MLAAYKSEGDPEKYEEAYADLKKFVEGALDIYKVCKHVSQHLLYLMCKINVIIPSLFF